MKRYQLLAFALTCNSLLACKSDSDNSSQVKEIVPLTASTDSIPIDAVLYWADDTKAYRVRCSDLSNPVFLKSMSPKACKETYATSLTSLDLKNEFLPRLKSLLEKKYKHRLNQANALLTGDELLRDLENRLTMAKPIVTEEQYSLLERDFESHKIRVEFLKKNAKQIATIDTAEKAIEALLNQLRAGDENPVATMRHIPSGDRLLFSDLLAEVFLHRPTDQAIYSKAPFFAEQYGYALQYVIAPYSETTTGVQACRALGYWHLSEVSGIRARGLLYPFEKLTIQSKVHAMLENKTQNDFVNFLKQSRVVTIPDSLEPSKIWGGGHMVWSINDAYIVKASNSNDIATVSIKKMTPKLIPSGWLCIALGDASIAKSPL